MSSAEIHSISGQESISGLSEGPAAQSFASSASRSSSSAQPLRTRLEAMPKRLLTDLLARLSESSPGNAVIISNALESAESNGNIVHTDGNRACRKDKEFDMSKYSQRHVALQIQYDGTKYFGFVAQKGDCDETVEKHLFEALIKTKLIESKESCNYSRCGRTDRGVSAMRQVIGLNLRSSRPKHWETMDPRDVPVEIDYCGRLNKVLPADIRALGVSFVSPEFSARFSAITRTYRYFFIRRNLDIPAMEQGAQHLVGEHDFRNLCKLDAPNVTNFVRQVLYAKIVLHEGTEKHPERSTYYLELCGNAFLWHMVRSIMSILFLVGERSEQPSVVSRLLDVVKEPAKPDYKIAPDEPLLLYDCAFENLKFQYSPLVLRGLEEHFEGVWERHTVAAAQAKTALDWIQDCDVRHEDMLYLLEYAEHRVGNRTRKAAKVEDIMAPLMEEYMTLVTSRSSHIDNPTTTAPTEGGCSMAGASASSRCKRMREELDTIAGASCDAMDTTPSSEENGTAVVASGSASVSGATASLHAHSKGIMRWADVKHIAMKTLHSKYVPLMERPRGEAYGRRQERLSGTKRERLERHLRFKEAGDGGLEFFAKKKLEGSVDAAAS